MQLMLSPRRYSCDELRHTGAARYAAGRELPGGDVILPSGLASVVAAVADSLDTELVTVTTGTRVTNIDWWVVSGLLLAAICRSYDDGHFPCRRSEAVVKVRADTGAGSHVTTCRHALVTLPLGVLQVPSAAT